MTHTYVDFPEQASLIILASLALVVALGLLLVSLLYCVLRFSKEGIDDEAPVDGDDDED